MRSLRGGDETAAEVAELKKGERFERCEKEVESLKKERDEIEKRVRDFERRNCVLEVKEMEEKSKRVRVEEEMRERCNQRDELWKKVTDLKLELAKDVRELEHYKSEKKLTMEDLSESQKKEMEMELKKDELLKKVEDANKTIAALNERIMETTNGVRATKDFAVSDGYRKCSLEGELQWPVVAAGSVGVVGSVAAMLFLC